MHTQPDLPDSGREYPERPRFFAMQYQDQLLVSQAIRTIGTDGFALLVRVVLAEDRLWYRRAPNFWNSELTADLAWSEDKLDRVRRKLVTMGLLHFERERKRDAASYWVLTPAWLEPPTEVPHRGDSAGDPAPVRGDVRGDVRNLLPYSPVPNSLDPTPPPPSPSVAVARTGAGSEAWAAVEREMIELGIGEPEKPLREMQGHQVLPDLALGVLRFASESKAWNGGKIRRRLINLRPGQNPRNVALWMQPDHPERLPRPARASSPAVQHLAVQREEDGRLRQLLLDYEREVAGKSIREIIDTFHVPAPLSDQLTRYQRWDHIRSDRLQIAVLEIVQRHVTVRPN